MFRCREKVILARMKGQTLSVHLGARNMVCRNWGHNTDIVLNEQKDQDYKIILPLGDTRSKVEFILP